MTNTFSNDVATAATAAAAAAAALVAAAAADDGPFISTLWSSGGGGGWLSCTGILTAVLASGVTVGDGAGGMEGWLLLDDSLDVEICDRTLIGVVVVALLGLVSVD